MMQQEPQKLAEDMLYLGELIAESLTLIELCQDCLNHDLEDRDTKLKTLLSCLESNIFALTDDFPYRLKVLRASLDALAAPNRTEQKKPSCT